MGVWDAFGQGLQLGGNLRARANQREQGEAYQSGGWDAVQQTAAGQGDMRAVKDAGDEGQQQQESAIGMARNAATVISNVATALEGVPYEQRRERIQQMAPMLVRLGVPEQEIASFDPTDENIAIQRWLAGEFEKYADIQNGENGEILGILRDGTVEVIKKADAPEWQNDGTTPYRITPEGGVETGAGAIPHRPRAEGSGGVQYSSVTPEQAQEYNLPGDGAGFVMGSNGLPRRVGGGGTFPADQRARVAVMYQPALEASQLLERMDSQAVSRRGSHTSDTPLGQDWGARVAEAVVPFDDGAVARAVGGADYNRYVSASSSFESAMLPILSGAAVVESEARRIIRAALPQLNDTREVLADKARRRQQMLNGAALIGSQPQPYPEAGVPEWATRAAQAVQSAGGGAEDFTLETATPEQLDAIEAELMNGSR